MIKIDELRLVYKEIIEGFSHASPEIVVKHLCDLEQIEIVRKRLEFRQSYINQGIPTEEERLKQIIDDGEWGAGKD